MSKFTNVKDSKLSADVLCVLVVVDRSKGNSSEKHQYEMVALSREVGEGKGKYEILSGLWRCR